MITDYRPNSDINPVINTKTQAQHSTQPRHLRTLIGLMAATLIVSGCSYVPNFIRPFRPDIQQGNWVTQSQVDNLRVGMTREQVRFALGTPTISDIFNEDRWDYPYRFTPGRGGERQAHNLVVIFEKGKLVQISYTELPNQQPFQAIPPKAELDHEPLNSVDKDLLIGPPIDQVPANEQDPAPQSNPVK